MIAKEREENQTRARNGAGKSPGFDAHSRGTGPRAAQPARAPLRDGSPRFENAVMSGTFPHDGTFEIEGVVYDTDTVLRVLHDQITEERRARIDEVIRNRTYTVVTVLDGIYDQGNVSAVIRSIEGLGFAELHILETADKFKASRRIAQGADKWLDVHRYQSVEPCLENLKSRGYRLLATHLEAATPLDELDFTQPTALVFGNEKYGVSPEILEACDARVIVPMMGFSQSFNISVATAICMYHVLSDRRRRLGANGDLTDEQQRILRAHYYLRSVESHAAILRRQAGSR